MATALFEKQLRQVEIFRRRWPDWPSRIQDSGSPQFAGFKHAWNNLSLYDFFASTTYPAESELLLVRVSDRESRLLVGACARRIRKAVDFGDLKYGRWRKLVEDPLKPPEIAGCIDMKDLKSRSFTMMTEFDWLLAATANGLGFGYRPGMGKDSIHPPRTEYALQAGVHLGKLIAWSGQVDRETAWLLRQMAAFQRRPGLGLVLDTLG